MLAKSLMHRIGWRTVKWGVVVSKKQTEILITVLLIKLQGKNLYFEKLLKNINTCKYFSKFKIIIFQHFSKIPFELIYKIPPCMTCPITNKVRGLIF